MQVAFFVGGRPERANTRAFWLFLSLSLSYTDTRTNKARHALSLSLQATGQGGILLV